MLWRIFWTLATLWVRSFYLGMGIIFWVVNSFKPKQRVAPISDPILMSSATKLAKLIKRREVVIWRLIVIINKN